MIEYTALLYSTNDGSFVDYEKETQWFQIYIDRNDKELIKIYNKKLIYLINLYFEE